MMKQGYLRASQENCFDEIHLAYRGAEDVTADQILAGIAADEEAQRLKAEAAADADGADATVVAATDAASEDTGDVASRDDEPHAAAGDGAAAEQAG